MDRIAFISQSTPKRTVRTNSRIHNPDGKMPTTDEFRRIFSAVPNGDNVSPQANILLTLAQSLAAGHLADVTFRVSDSLTQVPAHKLILSLTSPVFRTMFYGSLPEKNDIEISDVLVKPFKILLQYLYTTQFLIDDDEISIEEAINLLYASRKYDIPDLEQLVSVYLENHIMLDTVIKILEASMLYELNTLETQCWNFLEYHADQFFQTEQFLDLQTSTLEEILKRDCLSITEAKLWAEMNRWAETQCTRHGLEPTCENLRKVLGDLIFLIRFPIMKPSDFADGPARSGILSEKEVSSVFTYMCSTSNRPVTPFKAEARRWRNPEIYSQCHCTNSNTRARGCNYCQSGNPESRGVGSVSWTSSPTPPVYCPCRTRAFCPRKRGTSGVC